MERSLAAEVATRNATCSGCLAIGVESVTSTSANVLNVASDNAVNLFVMLIRLVTHLKLF